MSRAVSAQDAPTSSRAVSVRDYNVNVLASSLLQRQQQYQTSRPPEVRRPFDVPKEAEPKQNIPIVSKDPRLQKNLPETVELVH